MFSHQLLDIIFSALVVALFGLISWLVRGRISAAETQIESCRAKLGSHDIQIRDTRTAIAEARTKVGLPSFPYTE